MVVVVLVVVVVVVLVVFVVLVVLVVVVVVLILGFVVMAISNRSLTGCGSNDIIGGVEPASVSAASIFTELKSRMAYLQELRGRSETAQEWVELGLVPAEEPVVLCGVFV